MHEDLHTEYHLYAQVFKIGYVVYCKVTCYVIYYVFIV